MPATQAPEKNAGSPGYRHPWFWLILLLPAVSVVAGIALVVIAMRHQDSLVRDDWYKEGKVINQGIARDSAATRLDQRADFRIDELTGEIRVTLKTPSTAPALTLLLSHPTQAVQDQTLTLQRREDGQYHGLLVRAPEGRFHVELGNAEWRLLGEREFPLATFTLTHD